MSEERLFGQASTEAIQGYEALPDTAPKEPETYGSDAEGLRRAASDLVEARHDNAIPLVERGYQYQDGDKAGSEVEPNKTVALNRAVRDLSAARETEAVDAAKQASSDFAEAVDAMRSHANGAPIQQPSAQPDGTDQPADITQPQSDDAAPLQPASPGIDPDVAKALENPKVRQALEAEVQKVDIEKRAYSMATAHVSNLAAASVLSAFPELNGLTAEQLPVALSIMAQQNPARAAQVSSHLERTAKVYETATRAKQIEFAKFADQQDRIFEDSISRDNPERVREIKSKAVEVASTVYGIARDELAHLYNTEPLLRTAALQRMMYDAVAYNLAKQAKPAARPAPAVLKPGTADANQPVVSDSVQAAQRAFEKSPSAKTAAVLLNSRRAAAAQ